MRVCGSKHHHISTFHKSDLKIATHCKQKITRNNASSMRACASVCACKQELLFRNPSWKSVSARANAYRAQRRGARAPAIRAVCHSPSNYCASAHSAARAAASAAAAPETTAAASPCWQRRKKRKTKTRRRRKRRRRRRKRLTTADGTERSAARARRNSARARATRQRWWRQRYVVLHGDAHPAWVAERASEIVLRPPPIPTAPRAATEANSALASPPSPPPLRSRLGSCWHSHQAHHRRRRRQSNRRRQSSSAAAQTWRVCPRPPPTRPVRRTRAVRTARRRPRKVADGRWQMADKSWT